MHLSTGVVQRRNAKEYVISLLLMVILLHFGCISQSSVIMQDRLRKTGGTGGEVDGCVIGLTQGYRRGSGGTEGHESQALLGVCRTIFAHEEHVLQSGQLFLDQIHTADEFGTKYQNFNICQFHAVFDLIAGVAEVHGNGDAAGLQNTKIYRKPFQTVHHQDGHLGATLQASAHQQVGEAIGSSVKIAPADLAAVGGIGIGILDQVKLAPCGGLISFIGRIDLHQ